MASGKIIIGILGRICSGKSTVAAEFARLGCDVIDADEIAHGLLEKSDIKEQIKEAFGDDVFDSTGRVDRNKLAEKVFEDEKTVERINRIIHPPVLAKCEELITEFNSRSNIKAIVLDVPLLAEAGWLGKCNKLIFVDCDEEIRARRAAKKGGFFKKSAKKTRKFTNFSGQEEENSRLYSR